MSLLWDWRRLWQGMLLYLWLFVNIWWGRHWRRIMRRSNSWHVSSYLRWRRWLWQATFFLLEQPPEHTPRLLATIKKLLGPFRNGYTQMFISAYVFRFLMHGCVESIDALAAFAQEIDLYGILVRTADAGTRSLMTVSRPDTGLHIFGSETYVDHRVVVSKQRGLFKVWAMPDEELVLHMERAVDVPDTYDEAYHPGLFCDPPVGTENLVGWEPHADLFLKPTFYAFPVFKSGPWTDHLLNLDMVGCGARVDANKDVLAYVQSLSDYVEPDAGDAKGMVVAEATSPAA